jgi:ribonuclease BN (tRNA processing enzyme)
MDAPYFPVPFDAMQAEIEFDIQENGAHFAVGDVQVATIKQQHPGDSWGYSFKKGEKNIIFSSDSEHGTEAQEEGYPFVDFLHKADILIFDGQYTSEEASEEKRNWGHSDHITAIELAARAKVCQLIVSHHEPGYSDSKIEEIHQSALRYSKKFNQKLSRDKPANSFPEHIKVAFDGLVIEA